MKLKNKATASAIKINAENFDSGIMYLGDKIPTASIRKEAIGLEVPKKLVAGFLVVEGDKPGLAVHPVLWDGEDRYKRVTRLGKTVYGSLESINNTCGDRLNAEVLTVDELKARAKKIGKAIEAKRRSDDKQFKVLLLAPPEQTCFAGITIRKGHVEVLNMEPVRPNNDKELQFTDITETPAKPLLKELAAAA
jgi:hypothetical protein